MIDLRPGVAENFDVGRLGQRGMLILCDRDRFGADDFERGQHVEDLRGFPAVGNHDDKVVLCNHPHVAMQRFTAMDKKGGNAQACHCGGDLFADVAGLAKSGNDYPPLAI